MGFLFFLIIITFGLTNKKNKMKNILFIALFTIAISTEAQITIEHTYDTAATYNFCQGNACQLMIINFEVSGEQYVKINRCGKVINIYDMNHTLLKNISLAGIPLDGYNVIGDILYLSEHLFDLDDGIEFMYCTTISGGGLFTGIYKEDGSLIFSDTSCAYVIPNYEQQQYPIYNTSHGTKMILSYRNGQAKVFSLPGTLSGGIAEANEQLMQQNGQFNNLYPNPSNGAVTLQYELPKGETEGEIILYNQQGAEVKRYKVDNTFKDIIIDNTQLSAGTYFYQLQTSKGIVGVKKMIVIK